MKKEWFAEAMVLAGYTGSLVFFAMFRTPKMLSAEDTKRYDAALVCGYPARADGSVSAVMKSRIDTGISLYKKKKVRRLLLSGGSVKNEYKEAQVMKQYALSQGIPEEDILVEDQSGSTYANMKCSVPIIRRNQIHSLLVVTNDWHLRKADHYARKLKTDYAMVEAERPEGESLQQNIRLHFTTNITVFYNLWKGLY